MANVFLRVPYVGYNVFHRQHKEIQIVEFVEQSIQPRGGPFFCGVRVMFNCAGNNISILRSGIDCTYAEAAEVLRIVNIWLGSF